MTCRAMSIALSITSLMNGTFWWLIPQQPINGRRIWAVGFRNEEVCDAAFPLFPVFEVLVDVFVGRQKVPALPSWTAAF